MAGFLMLNGGGEFHKGLEQADLFALQQAGGKEARALIITVGPEGVGLANNGVNWLRSLGAANLEALPLADHAEADREDIAAKLAEGDLIYLAGSDPLALLETLGDSRAWAALRQAFAGGATLVGANAGGMILMEHLYDPASGKVRSGLLMFPNTIFVPQFNGPGRKWVPQIQKVVPQALLVGIDEKVAIGGRGNDWQVYGRGWITIYRQGKPYKYQGGQPFKMNP